LHRRSLLATTAIITAAATAPLAARAAAADGAPASSITIEADAPGTAGTAAARKNDLVLIHYTGTVAATGEVFDTTLGLGLTYRDGGPGTLRPLALRLSGDPIPGVCAGLQQALLGMTAGGSRTVLIPPELGFGAAPAAAPYAVIPGGSALRYEVKLLRLSRRGPDALFAGMSKCSQVSVLMMQWFVGV
jgi:FKBP-type peptidyl-prolyl cis-trans isomerase